MKLFLVCMFSYKYVVNMLQVCKLWRQLLERNKNQNQHCNISHDKTCPCLEKQHHQLPSEAQTLQGIGSFGCESWTLTADTERRIQSFDNKCYRRMFNISYREHKIAEFVRQLVTTRAGEQKPLLTSVRLHKLCWYGHTARHTSLSKTFPQGTVEGQQRKSWMGNIKEWTGCSFPTLLRSAQDRELWRSLTTQASSMTPPYAP